MMEIPTGLPPELVPLSWLIGVWEGEGMVEYAIDGETRMHPFRQRVEFRHDDLPHLEYRSQVWLLPTYDGADSDEAADDAEAENAAAEPVAVPLSGEVGYWRLARERDAGDVGPGLLPPTQPSSMPNADAVETLRNGDGGFDLEVSIAHPTGVIELYYGMIRGPRVDLATDGVLRAKGAEDYRSATRLYGLVQNRLFWAWDIAALDQELATHASAQLDRVDPAESN